MCGIFGFSGLFAPVVADILHCAELASTRGPHSHGWAYPKHGEWATHRADGPLDVSIDFLRETLSSVGKTIIGHSRMATTGTYAGGAPNIEDTMPFIVGDMAVVHNGNVRKYREIARRRAFSLQTGCDSEIIAHLLMYESMNDHDASLTELLDRVIPEFDDGRPFALLAATLDGEIASAHRDLPMFVANADEGTYFCSRRPLIDDATIVLSPPIWGWPHMPGAPR